jgi:lactoylglutathione lyase
MIHTGFTVASTAAAMKFYADLLGFHEFWRGSSDDKELSWINMRVPDGEDYVEFMLYRDPPSAQRLGTMNHICLVVPNIEKAADELKQRAASTGYTRAIEVRTGKNRKRQCNLYDPDGTRVELMEPDTVDGKPTPSSTAVPPRP